mmetsp:Transcript_21111/g.30971  ORF Transcript_21111/g.30971 Transcript_21111/m.30971 type:complete len:86 (+) Transcript_21111:65-322(+)|eukprot:CAMPEP_0195525072 /NCGR_PEP_ID=MMETSP0794_2-20130614/25275_1 /TAXON_ID=515487 /ORGANISM="Stephanopyxis turris, Strain CCMP 815" /LENGTH=85 /DNA_ID=CAMNT_0040655427 /DNA_START=65 /DNA_END=322 /DNA_ORIENTATION=+
MESSLASLTPEQRQQLMVQAQNEANQSVMQQMMEKMVQQCFKKCAGTSGDKLDSREQSCMANCQDRYLDARAQVQEALAKRQSHM